MWDRLIEQVNNLGLKTISVEQYLFGRKGGPIEDITKRRRVFLSELQHQLLKDFFGDGIGIPSNVVDFLPFLTAIRPKVRDGSIKMIPTGSHSLAGHPHRLLSLIDVLNMILPDSVLLPYPNTLPRIFPTGTSGSNPMAEAGSIEDFRSKINLSAQKQSDDRIVCMLRLGEVLFRRFVQWEEPQDLNEAIFYYKSAWKSTKSSILGLEACLGLCESLYRRLVIGNNFEDFIELMGALEGQTSLDLFALIGPVVDQLENHLRTRYDSKGFGDSKRIL